MNLDISNVITVSVSEAGVGAGQYNTSNLAIFTREAAGGGFGGSGYKIYKSPTEVGVDFGTGSQTYSMANKIFSQRPNILANNGYLVVIPFVDTADVVEVQKVSFTEVPASGSFKLKYGAEETSALLFSDNAAAVQAALRLLTGLGSVTVTGDFTAGFTVTFTGVSGDATLLTAPMASNSLQTATPNNIDISVATLVAGTTVSTETLVNAITRTKSLVQYFGVMASEISSEVDMLAAAAAIEALDKMAFFVSYTAADVEVAGMLDKLRSNAYSHSRGLFYGGNTTTALAMMAAYAGRALSTNFDGDKTTQTMHMKSLKGVEADSSMTQTLLGKCQAAGVDVYCSIEGVSGVFCSKLNTFFDRVYNLLWYVGAIKIAGFNMIVTTGSKITQTEDGIDSMKSSYRNVCEKAVKNQYAAPGEWTRPDTFGDQADFMENIRQRGYYLYSTPVAQQSAEARAARQAPVVQIALKEAGAIHSGNILIAVNE